jgi:hypothetical protein
MDGLRRRRRLIALMLLIFVAAAIRYPDIYGWWWVPIPF